ncbi:MAG: nucleotide pyrophosphatase [Deltaproteobacteria bacterium]|nr:nucleotide pyrophosphatase [Deltaproteobacteria bacterium]
MFSASYPTSKPRSTNPLARAYRRSALVLGAVVVLCPELAHAYIGPGAGFAFAGSLLMVAAALGLALLTVLLWPITTVWRLIRVGNPFKGASAKRIVIVGLDGMDPGIATRFMQEGKLPNFQRLAESGVFRPLDTSNPSMSPVAWSTFSTGVDPSRHGIYDFITRDPCTCAPMLSSTDIQDAKRVLNIGRFMVPLEKPKIKLLQKGTPFWKLLGDRHISSIVQRVPITFPPQKFRGLLLSGMCVPDLRGSQGTFSFFSTASNDGQAAFTGGEQTILRRNKQGVIRSRIVGPDNGMEKGRPRMVLPFSLIESADRKSARLEIDGCEPITLEPQQYSEWVTLTFTAGLGVKVQGIVRFYLMSLEPEVNLYMTPIHIDPEKPAMPISHPAVYSVYLAKKQGKFATLGLAEDTWALNERVIDERAFFDQAMLFCDERETMFFDALAHTKKGMVTTVFDTTDRIQHMFYRYLDPTHPANRDKESTEYADAIERTYQRMDAMLGRLQAEVGDDPDTVLIVMSDHGFTNFRRGVNLNAWLRDNGYLVLKDGARTGGDWFENVDWSKTRAFSLGLTGLFINRKGREKSGIVQEGDEYVTLLAELMKKLEALVDPSNGQRAIRKVRSAVASADGPYRYDAPDLLVGYEGGYRNSWECATGRTTEEIFSDNTKSWSGDHCVDPDIVPGVFFCNRAVNVERPHIADISVSVLRLFGQTPLRQMQGRMIFADAEQPAANVTGPLDPSMLSQSGSAVGALMHGPRREAVNA